MTPAALPAAPRDEPRMGLRLRRAIADDVDEICALKRRLPLTPDADGAAQGGFLLGVSRARYAQLVRHANVFVVERRAALVGFAVTLPDSVLRSTDVWARRDGIEWAGAPLTLADDARVGYFDQLACLPGWWGRLGAPALALRALLELTASGHQHVFATVVRAPVHNRAALSMLRAVGARRAGRLAEHHDPIGTLLSDVYHLDLSKPRAARPWNDTALGRRIQRQIQAMLAGSDVGPDR